MQFLHSSYGQKLSFLEAYKGHFLRSDCYVVNVVQLALKLRDIKILLVFGLSPPPRGILLI